MKVLCIGGTGNISSAVSAQAVAQGVELYLYNRGNRASAVRGARSIVGDVADLPTNREVLGHTWDAVINWIAFTPEDIKRDVKSFTGRTRQYIFISSASAYQKPPAYPIITESTPLANPFWQYSRNKIDCEEHLNLEYRERGFPITIVRPSLTYNTVIPLPIGAWKEYTTVDRIKKGRKIIVHGDGTSLWTVTHAEDFAAAFLGLVGHQQAIGHAFHITSDEILTWNQIHQAVAEAVGCSADIVHIPSDFLASQNPDLRGSLLGDKAHSTIFDNTKIKRFVPGWAAKIPFKTGIKQVIDWFEADPSRVVIKQSTNDSIDRILAQYEKSVCGSTS